MSAVPSERVSRCLGTGKGDTELPWSCTSKYVVELMTAACDQACVGDGMDAGCTTSDGTEASQTLGWLPPHVVRQTGGKHCDAAACLIRTIQLVTWGNGLKLQGRREVMYRNARFSQQRANEAGAFFRVHRASLWEFEHTF